MIEDIRDAEAHGAGSIFFPDDNITLDPKRLERLCQAIIDAGLTHLRYKTQASASGIASSKQLVDKMGEAGFDGVFLGVESINKRNLEFLGKGKMSNDAELAVQYLHDNNIIVSTGLIGGNPDDDEEDLWENFKLARRLKVDMPIFYISTPYPRTQMRAELEEMGLVTKNDFTKYDGLHANLRTKHLERRGSAVHHLADERPLLRSGLVQVQQSEEASIPGGSAWRRCGWRRFMPSASWPCAWASARRRTSSGRIWRAEGSCARE